MSKFLRPFVIFRLFFCLALSVIANCVVAQSRHALLIGISNYPKAEIQDMQWQAIHGSNDVSLLEPTLKGKGFAVNTLTNKNATAAMIRKALQNLQTVVGKGDVVYVHFSCHGQPVEDLSGDEKDGWDEALVPYDAYKAYRKGVYEGDNHILDDELAKIIDAIRRKIGAAGFVYVVIDACHAGGSSRGEEDDDEEELEVFTRGTNSGFSKKNKRFAPRIDTRAYIAITPSKKMARVCYVEACRSYQNNVEIRQEKQYYGPLSFYINNVLHNIPSLSANTNWLDEVQKLMANDSRLKRQNVVIESSK